MTHPFRVRPLLLASSLCLAPLVGAPAALAAPAVPAAAGETKPSLPTLAASPAPEFTVPGVPSGSTGKSERPTREQITSSSGPGGRNITAFDRGSSSGVGGYYALDFKQPLDGVGSHFDLHQLILQVSSQPHEHLFFNTEIEFEHGGLINAGTNDGELKIEQCWADYAPSELLGVRGGIVLIPFGIVNVLHDADVRETTVRPLMATTVIPTTWFEPGVGLHGIAYPTEDLQLSYEGYLTQGLTSAISPTLGLAPARPSLSKDNNGNKAFSGRLGLSPWLGCELGLNGYYGAYDSTGTKHLGMLGADLTYGLGPVELVGEYARVQTEGGTSTAVATPLAIPTAMEGFYLEGRYRFFPELLHQTFLGRAGGFPQATLTAVVRGGAVDTNKAAFDASDRTEALIGLNYRPIQTFAGKVELSRQDELATGRTAHTIWASLAVGY